MNKKIEKKRIKINGRYFTEIEGSRLPSDFKRAVDMLQRPYEYISKEDYERLMAWGTGDVVIDGKGRQYTFGNFDCCHFALMPLQRECYYAA